MKKDQLTKEAMLYQSLGHLSTRFAHMEELLKELLIQMITQQKVDTLIGRIMVDDFPLLKTLQSLKKLLRTERKIETQLKLTLAMIEDLRKDRNYFVHGLWQEPVLNKKTTEIEIQCASKRIIFKEDEDSRTWTTKSHKKFTLTDIHNCREKVEKAISKLQEILDKIEEREYYFQ